MTPTNTMISNTTPYPGVRSHYSQRLALPNPLLSLGDIFSFAAPALQFVQIQAVGTLLGTDLLLLAALPLALVRHPDRLKRKPVPAILALGVVWLISQIVTDLVRHSAPEDYLRGWTKITLMLVSFTVLWIVVCRSFRRFVLYGIGTAVGGILTLYIHPTDDMLDSPWKFGLAGPITVLVVVAVACLAKRSYLGILVPMAAMAVVHSFANTRSLALLCLLSAGYTVFQMSMARRQKRMGAGRLVLLAGVAICCVYGFMLVYTHYAEQGVFGQYAQRKLEAQSGDGGLLLGGRSESLASTQAIMDSPLLGHGSWAHDAAYIAIMQEKRAELGYKNFQNSVKDDLIPTHSHIFGAWVEAGLLGAVFWLYVLVYAVRSLAKVSGAEPWLLLFAYQGFGLVWDIFFSPISPERRFTTPYLIVAMIVLASLRNLPLAASKRT